MRKHTASYESYIRSAAWEQKRQERLVIDKKTCQMCGRSAEQCKKSLQIHHLNYSTLGNENPLTDLVTLCGSCHAKLHRLYRRERGYRKYVE